MLLLIHTLIILAVLGAIVAVVVGAVFLISRFAGRHPS